VVCTNYSPKAAPDESASSQATPEGECQPTRAVIRHTSPHSPTMDVWLTSIIRLASSKDDLKTKAPIRDRRDSDSQRMYILPVIFSDAHL
jgi:hypothetical protein